LEIASPGGSQVRCNLDGGLEGVQFPISILFHP
jgi:hypothetical protein